MEILIWIIGAIAIAVIRNAASGKIPKFPRLPDGRHDTPLGPSGHRSWPLKPAIEQESSRTSRPSIQQPDKRPQLETVQPTVKEVDDTVREGIETFNSTVPAPVYENEKRRQPTTESSHPVGRPVRRSSLIAFQKDDLVRAVVMSEVLGAPRARQANLIPGKRRK